MAATAQGQTEFEGVRNLLRQGHRLMVPRQPLVRIAQSTTAPRAAKLWQITQRRPYRATQRCGAAGDRRALYPA